MPDPHPAPILRQNANTQAWFARLRALGRNATSQDGLRELARTYHQTETGEVCHGGAESRLNPGVGALALNKVNR
jgi:hypothetical protein